MLRRAPRPGGPRAARAGAAVVAAVLAGAIVPPISHAQPAQPAQPAPPAPALSRAKDLYQSAEAAMKDGRFEDAARDYGTAYELSKDPALLFKIGRANERAGKCNVALTYYARYLSDGQPSEQFAALTKERITACGGNAHSPEGSAGSAGSTGNVAPVKPAPSADSQHTAPPATGSGAVGAGSTTTSAASADVPASTKGASAAAVLTPSNRHKAAWLLTGSAVALVTLGGVLAYAANSSENDVRDLYAGFAGQPPTFDAQTKRRYDDLIDQGRRYQHLSWASFGLAGATATGAAVLFMLGGRAGPAEHARITPVVTTTSAGVAVRF